MIDCPNQALPGAPTDRRRWPLKGEAYPLGQNDNMPTRSRLKFCGLLL